MLWKNALYPLDNHNLGSLCGTADYGLDPARVYISEQEHIFSWISDCEVKQKARQGR